MGTGGSWRRIVPQLQALIQRGKALLARLGGRNIQKHYRPLGPGTSL